MLLFAGEVEVLEWTMERVIECLEAKCHENMETKKKTEEGLGIEYDEDIVCEICQSVSVSLLIMYSFRRELGADLVLVLNSLFLIKIVEEVDT